MDQILRINMGADGGPAAKTEPVGDYAGAGGRGLTSAIVSKEVPPLCHPLGEDNKLVIAPGLLSGSTAAVSGRLSVGCKSPLTGGIKEANAGGQPSQMLGRLGYAAIVLEGQPKDNTLYKVFINKDGVDIQEANDLCMLGNYDLVDKMKAEYGEKISCISIGPAGEMKLAAASVACTDMELRPTRHAGRGGVGAVMGAKGASDIIFRNEARPDLWSVEADRGQIEQVLMNLYLNALQAMPSSGTLTTGTENVTIDQDQYSPYYVKAGNYVKIAIADTGIGMDEDTQQRIFDPFFTTKEMGRGTGLGLASVYGIVKNHGGFINVFSKKGQGTKFEIYLPASGKAVSAPKKGSEKFVEGRETVMLVDDEDMIIDVGTRMLKKLGYQVFIARDGKEAIEIFKKHPEEIDLVVLDMIMPKMGGGETYDRIKKIKPDVKVLLSSGFSINGQASEILNRGCNGFIQKPFNLQNLSKNLRAILEGE